MREVRPDRCGRSDPTNAGGQTRPMREGLRFPEVGKIAPPKLNRSFHFLPPLIGENIRFPARVNPAR